MKNLQDAKEKLGDGLGKIQKYLPVIFACLLLIIYGFLMYRINVLTSAGPDTSTSPAKTARVPHIDPKLLDQLQSLQDNSTSVQTLFDQARDNPFQE